MSRIHEALKKAEAERRSAAPALEVSREGGAPEARPVATAARPAGMPSIRPVPPSAPAVAHRLPDRQLAPVRFSATGEAVLARSYEEIERFCADTLEPALADLKPVRVLLVTSLAPQAQPAKLALALAATLVDRLRVAAVVVDCASTDRGAAELFDGERRGPGLADLLRDPGQLTRCIRRTPLQGLYFLPAGESGGAGERFPANEGGRAEAALLPALERLQEVCHVIVLAADSVSSDPRVVGLAGLAQATVLVARDPHAASQEMRERLFVPDVRLYGIRELP
jgi:Mrp family chromosome partitioning ATPase